MCGRYVLHSRERINLRNLSSSDLSILDLPWEARYNIAPSQDVLVIADFGTGVEGRLLSWGLIPNWSTDGKGFINARAETLEEKPSFSESFRLRRCLIPADGFFEWKRAGREKRPYYLSSKTDESLMFAGIWDAWRNHGQAFTACAIITTAANELVSELHDRMPAILAPEDQEAWLDRRTLRTELLSMLAPYPAEKMKTYPVSSSVNQTDKDNPDLITRVDAEVGMTMSLF